MDESSETARSVLVVRRRRTGIGIYPKTCTARSRKVGSSVAVMMQLAGYGRTGGKLTGTGSGKLCGGIIMLNCATDDMACDGWYIGARI